MALNVVIIGAVALGPKVACRLKRLVPDAKVTMVGSAGDFFGALNGGVTLFIQGEAGRFLGDSMSSGKIIAEDSENTSY